jgi:hypothetical protein
MNGWAIVKDKPMRGRRSRVRRARAFAFRQRANVALTFGHDAQAWAKYQCPSHARIIKGTRMIPILGKARQG